MTAEESEKGTVIDRLKLCVEPRAFNAHTPVLEATPLPELKHLLQEVKAKALSGTEALDFCVDAIYASQSKRREDERIANEINSPRARMEMSPSFSRRERRVITVFMMDQQFAIMEFFKVEREWRFERYIMQMNKLPDDVKNAIFSGKHEGEKGEINWKIVKEDAE